LEKARKGIFFGRVHYPIRLKIDATRLDDGKWRLRYTETFDEDTPEEAVRKTVEVVKALGIPIRARDKTVSFTITGSRDRVFGVVLGEALALSEFGDLTLRDIFEMHAIVMSESRLGNVRKSH